jgi:hypothetical protein
VIHQRDGVGFLLAHAVEGWRRADAAEVAAAENQP